MKTKLTYLVSKVMVAIILVAVLAVKAFAADSEGPKIKLIPYKNELAIVTINNVANENSELYIEDSNGEIVYYREGLKDVENSYYKTFDFRNLIDGDYRVVVENSKGKNEAIFSISEGLVCIKDEKKAPSPYFAVDNDVLKFSMLNHSLKNVKLTISNSNEAFYTKTLGDDFSITARFNIEALESGSYIVNLKSGKESYSFNFEK